MAPARDHAGTECLYAIAIIIRAEGGSQCLLESQALDWEGHALNAVSQSRRPRR
jgi:hypothetical protein